MITRIWVFYYVPIFLFEFSLLMKEYFLCLWKHIKQSERNKGVRKEGEGAKRDDY